MDHDPTQTNPTQDTTFKQRLESLSNDELREILLATSFPDNLGSLKKTDLINAVSRHCTTASAAKEISKIETFSVKKHFYMFHLSKESFKEIEAPTWDSLCAIAKKHPFSRFLDSSETLDNPEIEDSFALNTSIYLKYIKTITKNEWKIVDDRHKEMITTTHQIIFCFWIRKEDGVCVLSFDGYGSDGAGSFTHSLHYLQHISHLRLKINALLDIKLDEFLVSKAIDILTSDKQKIVRTKSDIRTLDGSQFQIDGKEQSIVTAINTLFSGKISDEDATLALRNSQTDSVYLKWINEGVELRIFNTEIGPDLYLIWRGCKNKGLAFTRIIADVVTASKESKLLSTVNFTEFINSLQVNQIFYASDFASRTGSSTDDALGLLHTLVKKGEAARCFRIKHTSRFQDYNNEWQEKADLIPQTLTDEYDQIISEIIPGRIEVGYKITKRGDL